MSRVDGYPQPYGAVIESIGTHVGPASYAALVQGSPPSGGDILYAAELGLKFFDSVEVLGFDATGTYTAMPVWATGITDQPTYVRLIWYVPGLVEVTPATALNTISLRIRATGH